MVTLIVHILSYSVWVSIDYVIGSNGARSTYWTLNSIYFVITRKRFGVARIYMYMFFRSGRGRHNAMDVRQSSLAVGKTLLSKAKVNTCTSNKKLI